LYERREATPQRFLVETALPLKGLSKQARREKAIRHGHMSGYTVKVRRL